MNGIGALRALQLTYSGHQKGIKIGSEVSARCPETSRKCLPVNDLGAFRHHNGKPLKICRRQDLNLHSHYRNQALKLILRAGHTFVLDGAYVARFCFCIGCVVIALHLNCRHVAVERPTLFPKCSHNGQREIPQLGISKRPGASFLARTSHHFVCLPSPPASGEPAQTRPF